MTNESNSDKARQKEATEKRVTTQLDESHIKPTKKAKNEFLEWADLFLPEDKEALKLSMRARIVNGFKTLISDLVNSFLFPGTGRPTTLSGSGDIYWTKPGSGPAASTPAVKPRTGRLEAHLDSRQSCYWVINELKKIIAEYGKARVTDFKELVRQQGTIADSGYAWKNVDSARIIDHNDGSATLVMPQPFEMQ